MAKKEKKKGKDKTGAKKPKTDPKKDKNKKKGKNKKKDGKKTDELTTSDPEELLLTTDPETDVEDQQYTDTSYSSASFESLPPPPVEEKPKKKRKKRKETVEETITRVSSEVWSEDSFPFEPDEAAQAVVEEEVVRKKKKKKKGRKGKKGKKVKEVKEEIPKFPKPKKWKKMNKKERDQWMEQQIEEWRQQKEIEKAAFIAGAKERRKEEARQRAEVLANDNAEQEIRKDILQKTCNLFHSFEKEKILYANNKQMKEEWHQYLRCDGLPDPRVVTQAATYLHVWREQQQWGGEELARRCEETLPMLEMLETFVANARHYSPQQAENYNEIRLALREQLHHTIQHVSYMLLRDLETNLTAHSIKLATYEKEFKGLQLNFWVAIRMPTRKPKPVETEPEPIELSFPSMKVTVTLPKVVDASCACVRAAKYMLDLLSESSRTYRLAEEPEDWYEDLYSFNVREHEAVTALSSEQEATRKDFFKAVKARVKELEGIIKANIYVRNKAAEEELEELSLKEPQGLGDPRAFIVQQNELEFADYLKRCNYRTRRGEINLRKYRICGGIIQIDLLETPPQPKRMRDDIDITTLPLPKRLQPMSYQVQYRAPSPPPPGVTRTPEEIEAEMRKIEAEYEKLALVHIDLPQDVMWLEPPVVVQWQESRRLWTTNYVNDFKYNEDKLTVQFRTGILWPIGLATLRYSNLPYQGWDIKPDPNGSGVIVLVTGVSVTISWLCVGNYVKLRSITNATTPALKEHLNKKYTVKKMVQIMRLAACDVFPGSDAHAHVEGARKQPALERHTYHAMAFLSRAYNFQWSRWNIGAGSRNIVMQIREAVDKKRQGKFQLINVSVDLGEGESSDDSDFRIEDHAAEESDDYSINSDDDAKKGGDNSDSSDGSESEDDGFKNSNQHGGDPSVSELLEKAKNKDFKIPAEYANMMICAGCLGSRSDDFNEIVECDGCGVTVHEGCYGVSDVTSESSTVSDASTEPWFCEACKAGVSEPSCELCPNKGGIFKETEVGAWVHLVCALYVPGVAFSEVERLSGVTLFEMAYSRWGARACALCDDATLARTGVAIGCDAGLCKTYFHVTCGQRCGLLAEAHSSEAEQADPFYAHCRLHSDKTLVARRRRSHLALRARTAHRKRELQENLSSQEKLRIQRKLVKYRRKYQQHKEHRNPPWVPTQKMARMLFSSASAMRKFKKKAEVMGVDTHALEFQDAQMAALKDVSRRWHIPPAFSVEFVGYYLERNHRVAALRAALRSCTQDNDALRAAEAASGADYDEASKANTTALAAMTALQESTMKLYDALSALRPAPPPPLLQPPGKRALAVPTAAALKMGVGFPLSDNPDATHGKVLSTSLQASPSQLTPSDSGTCCVCARPAARRLLATCDCCQRHYHPACLRPPLPRPPKKTKLYGWQCSECDKTSDSEPEVIEKKGPRRSRIRYSKDGAILPASPPPGPAPDSLSPIKVTIKPFEFTESDAAEKKKDKKLKKAKLKEQTSAAEMDSAAKKLKRSFTSPTLTNTPLMSITPIVAESPNDSHNENSNTSTAVATKADTSFLSTNSSFSSLIGEAKEKERDSKAIETSIETTLANLSSDIATYKANRKRRKEKHRSRYSPDLLRSPTKSHKHKRKKKAHPQLENPDMPHPRITIKIKPIPKPAGSTDTQMFYVPSDSNDAPPPPVVRTIPKQVIEEIQREPEAIVPIEPLTADQSSERGRLSAARGRGRGGARGPPRDLPALTHCDVCSQPGAPANLVRCDECFKRYHLSCLEPPLSKNPKKRGYSWHCADCDPTDVEDNN